MIPSYLERHSGTSTCLERIEVVVALYAGWATLSFFGMLSGANSISRAGRSPVLWLLGSGFTVFLLAFAAYHGV
jgi:hypothetical protein